MKLANQDRSRRSTPSSTAAVLLLLVAEYGLAKAWRAVRALAQPLPL
jgi:hypothetical protein